ncbi:MAG: GGDEF domain-containing protein [Candidimonas sp.]|nr:MAG: GGDEF domain-containing protein [Candidimonas sp.]TAM24070.1 MAG: GGDEF domain-containing protein [Candidimonas sp.]TAM80337.1 MAG: GGDEF domain-containing protein [Candidimonas sp.]
MNSLSDPDEEAKSRLYAGLGGSQTLIALYDSNDILRYANDAFRQSFVRGTDHVDFSSIVRANHAAGVVYIGNCSIDTYVSRACARRRAQSHCSYPLELLDGKRLWLSETLLADGWLLCEATDVTMLKRAEASLRVARDTALEASQTDYLTNLPNRRYGFELLRHTLINAQTQRQALSIAIIDLDFFKNINDQYGHDAGDAALCCFAENCHAALRSLDTVARVGGEEFLFICPGATAQDALDILNRLHSKPIQVHLESRSIEFSYTFSAGVAEVSQADSMHSLLARADHALLAAKAHGRNTIEVAAA